MILLLLITIIWALSYYKVVLIWSCLLCLLQPLPNRFVKSYPMWNILLTTSMTTYDGCTLMWFRKMKNNFFLCSIEAGKSNYDIFGKSFYWYLQLQVSKIDSITFHSLRVINPMIHCCWIDFEFHVATPKYQPTLTRVNFPMKMQNNKIYMKKYLIFSFLLTNNVMTTSSGEDNNAY